MNTDTSKHIIEVWPGPMEGVMKTPFIRTAAHLKLVSRWMTPFIRVATHVPSKKNIAEFLGKKDHTTIMHGISKVEYDIEHDYKFKNNIDIIKKKLLL